MAHLFRTQDDVCHRSSLRHEVVVLLDMSRFRKIIFADLENILSIILSLRLHTHSSENIFSRL